MESDNKKKKHNMCIFRVLEVSDGASIFITRKVLRTFKRMDISFKEVSDLIKIIYTTASQYNFSKRANIIVNTGNSYIGVKFSFIDGDKKNFVITEIYNENGCYHHMRNKYDFYGFMGGGFIQQFPF
jgi:hypothetical protein